MGRDSLDEIPTKRCTKCKAEKAIGEFYKDNKSKGRHSWCKSCSDKATKIWKQANSARYKAQRRSYFRKYSLANLAYYLWNAAKGRAEKSGVPFLITPEDVKIPEKCPVLGIDLVRGKGRSAASSPSIDKIIPELGYIPANVIVISHRANQIKSNGTPEEHRRIADWLEAEIKKRGLK